jgi:peptide/nickel transport system permease protein
MAYIAKRLAYALLVIFSVLTIVFFLVRLSGDPTALFAPLSATPAEVEQLRKEIGLDQPTLIQYGRFLKRSLQGEFGLSLRYQQPALLLVMARLPATVALTLVALTFMFLIALPLGTLAAVKKNSPLDLFSSGLALFGQSVPGFWLGLVLILIFSVKLALFPSSGYQGLLSLILPGITLAAFSSSLVARMTRSSLIEVLGSNYITTARSKGLSEKTVILKHALRNAAIPIVTIIGLQVGPMLSGAIITEQVFGFPGMGRLAVQAVLSRDYPVVQAFVVVVAALITLTNLTVDILYYFLDPRIRHE